MDFMYSFPAVKGKQANKEYYISMVPLKYLVHILPEPTEYVAPEHRAQRRLNESRIPEIRDYIINNRDTYIFSSLTASIDGDYSFEEKISNTGILRVSMEAKILINDGQHRRAAIAQALLEDDTLGEETISVVFFEDRGLEKSQQMFTDLNMNAQKSSNSINTCYEMRNPLAVLTKNVVAENKFLHKYTDLEKDNLGKKSAKLFTLHTIYRVNKKIIKDENVVGEKEKKFVSDFWGLMIENIPELMEMDKKQLSKKQLREDYVVTLTVLLLAFSRVGIWFYENRKVYMKKYMTKLKDIDWTRSNPNWYNRILRDNGKVVNNENAIILAGNYLKKCIGIELSADEEKRENTIS